MSQPKNLNSNIEYSGDIFIPEIDMDLDAFVKTSHEHKQSHIIHNKLKDYGVEHIGESVFLDEDLSIDLSQFEEKERNLNPSKKKSFLKKLIS